MTLNFLKERSSIRNIMNIHHDTQCAIGACPNHENNVGTERVPTNTANSCTLIHEAPQRITNPLHKLTTDMLIKSIEIHHKNHIEKSRVKLDDVYKVGLVQGYWNLICKIEINKGIIMIINLRYPSQFLLHKV